VKEADNNAAKLHQNTHTHVLSRNCIVLASS